MAKPESIGRFVNVDGHDMPGPPTGLAIIGSPTSSGGDFEWTAPAFAGGSPITLYGFYSRTPQGSGAYNLFLFAASSPVTIEDLVSGTAYDMYVVAINAAGQSAPSNVVQFTTA